MPGSILGTEVRRVEDQELLLGRGTFVDNLDSEGVAHAVFVRSPFAHARITGIDTSEAAAAEGVLAVYTADDLGRDNLPSFAMVNKQAPRSAVAVDGCHLHHVRQGGHAKLGPRYRGRRRQPPLGLSNSVHADP